MNIEEELEKVKAAIADPATRQQFLEKWVTSQEALVIGQDPTRRGQFAGDAGLSSKERYLWNNHWHSRNLREL